VIPAEMTGGWVRSGIALDGGRPREDLLVWWLQAPSKHCDLRVPLIGAEGPMSFAGITTWLDPCLTWTHELELEHDARQDDDSGIVTWEGADLLETGTFRLDNREVAYVERWRRLPGSDGELLALSCANGRIVRTGRYALTIIDDRPSGGRFAALAWTLEADVWTRHHGWPSNAIAPEPPGAIERGASTVELADRVQWTIDEHWQVPDGSGS
jgi:hypothetical protein